MTKKASFVIPNYFIKLAFSYETEADIPLQQLANPILSAFKRPDQVASRMKNEGGEGKIGALSSGGLQALGMGVGGGAGAFTPTKSKTGKILASILGSYLGLGTGGAVANKIHNNESKEQFSKSLKGALSEQDRNVLPSGLMSLIENGKADKFKQLAEQTIPGISDRPYIKEILKSQNPV